MYFYYVPRGERNIHKENIYLVENILPRVYFYYVSRGERNMHEENFHLVKKYPSKGVF